jgi:CAAX prenyl protease-like protein
MLQILKKPWFPYVFPFVLFLILTEPARLFPSCTHILYIGRTVIVGLLLWFWRHEYKPDFAPKLSFFEYLTAILLGLLVLLIWILPEEYLPQFGKHTGFNPYAFGWSQAAVISLIAVRIIGAAVVVPIMEELFWRSFFLRYLINQDFRAVPPGTFTWFSFIGVAILFGLEHHRVFVGIAAGVIYNLLMIRQKKLGGCIAAHAITNLGLGIYILYTEKWMFW